MRPDPGTPSEVAFDLLRRADALAEAATLAIAAGDDQLLTQLVEEREQVISAAVAAGREAVRTSHDPTMPMQIAQAADATARRAQITLSAARRSREAILVQLASLDARQHASHEYQADAPQATINVVF